MSHFQESMMFLVILVLSLSVHEAAHAFTADAFGDPTPRSQGRCTLNPIAHIDPIGFVMMCVVVFSGFGLGWGKPVQANPANMTNPRWGYWMTVLAGPLSNFAQAIIYAICYHLTLLTVGNPGFILQFFGFAVFVNCSLALFNLLPIGPLDGMQLVAGILPPKVGEVWKKFNYSYGFMLLLMLILIRVDGSSIVGKLVWEPTVRVASNLLKK